MRNPVNIGTRRSDDKPEVSWDGTGKHPILDMTAAEIAMANDAVTDKYAGTSAGNPEKKPQPSLEEQTIKAQETTSLGIELLAEKAKLGV